MDSKEIEETKKLYETFRDMLRQKSILFREDLDGGLVIFRTKEMNGLEYYVDEGTVALLKLLKEGISFNEILSVIDIGKKDEIIRAIKIRLLMLLNKPQLAGLNVESGYWAPPKIKYPHMAAWELTWRCNLKCIYCFSSAGDFDPRSYYEMSTEEIRKVIDKIKGKILSVWIGGGEPTLRRDLIEILTYLRKNDFYIMLSTNGVLLHGKIDLIKKIAELVDEIHIPIDGSSPEIHNKLRGEFNKAIEVIRSFVAYGANVSTGTVVTKLNIDDVPNIIDLAVNLGVKAWVWTPLFPCGRGYVNKHLMLDPKDLIKVFNLINWKQKEIGERLLIMRYTPGVTPLKMRSPTFKCGAINYYISIMPNGDVYPCPYFRWKQFRLGNLIADELENILDDNNKIVKLFRTNDIYEFKILANFLNIKVGEGCITCPLYLFGYCNTGCKAMKIVMGGGMLDPFPYCTKDIPGSPLHEIYASLYKDKKLY